VVLKVGFGKQSRGKGFIFRTIPSMALSILPRYEPTQNSSHAAILFI
jgi:hypothetical protein